MADLKGPVEAPALELEKEGTGELIREALDETRELVRLEVALARAELREELLRARESSIVLGGAAGLGLIGCALLLTAAALAFPMPWLAALILGGILLVVSALLGLAGWKALPRRPLEQTRARLESDLKQLRERAA